MTRFEWATSDNPRAMLDFARSVLVRRHYELLLRTWIEACRTLAQTRSDRRLIWSNLTTTPVSAWNIGHWKDPDERWDNPPFASVVSQQLRCDYIRDIFGHPLYPVAAPVDPLEWYWLTPTVQALARDLEAEENVPTGYLDPLRLKVLADALEEGGCPDVPCELCDGSGVLTQEHPFGDTFVTEVLSCYACEASGRVPRPLIYHLRWEDRLHVPGCWATHLLRHPGW